MRIWVNEEGADLDPNVDTSLGYATFSGDRWSLTGLNVNIPAGGRRFFATVDLSENADPLRDIRLALPVGNGFAVEMASGNDGPVDESLENPNTLGISITDRVILTSEWYPAGVALPGDQDLPLLKFVLNNTYQDQRQLRSLTFTNTALAAGATDLERDRLCQQLDLRLDGNNNGVLDSLRIDPRLGTGSFFEGRLTFGGMEVELPVDAPTRLFVTADLGLTTCADGNVLTGAIESISDIDIDDATVVAHWPMASTNEWVVNGMTAAQISTRDISVLTLGPGEGPVLAMDLTVPGQWLRRGRIDGHHLDQRRIGHQFFHRLGSAVGRRGQWHF